MTRLEQILVKMGFDVSESSKVKDAMGKVKDATKEGENGLEGFNGKGREAHELIRKIGAQSPILGSALKAAFNPEALGIIILITVIEFVVERFKALKEAAKEAAEAAIEKWKAHNDALREAAKSAEEFERKWDDIAAASAKASDPYKEQMKMLDGMIKQHEEILKLLEEQELAAAKGDKDKEDAIKKRYQNMREDASATDDAGRVTLMRKHIAELIAQRDEAFNKAEDAQTNNLNLKARPPEVDKAMLKEETASLNDAAQDYEEAKEDLEYVEQFHGDPAREKPAAEARDREIIKGYEDKLQRIKELQALVDKYDASLKKSQEDFDKYSKQGAEKDKESITTGQELRALTDKPTAAQTRKQAADLQKKMTPTAAQAAQVHQLDSQIASDAQLQQALQGVASATNPAQRKYWQDIADARTRIDRARYPGVPTSGELGKLPETQHDQEVKALLKSMADSTKKTADVLSGD